ncbi:MAG: NAD-dependent epimerase/dehydratase family protein [Myxococcales bacterium]|nr:NAD-dependent epimerase/dehydratase family protein [Myxococcales bacterium]
MKILVTGVAGLVGQMLARQLCAAGHDVIGVDRRRFADVPAGLHLCHVDLRKRAAEEVFRHYRPEVVVHMATIGHLFAESEERYRVNLGGTRAVFEQCRLHGAAHAIFVGRHTYYGAGPDSPLYHTEDEPPLGLASYPELADLVAADLYAGSALWRMPDLVTTVLRVCYSLGPSGHGTLATLLKRRLVPAVLGFDPLAQLMHEADVVDAIATAIRARPRGVFNVCGPSPLPLSVLVRETGRRLVPIPEPLIAAALGRFGLPKLSRGALGHLKHSIVVDGSAFRRATGFVHTRDEVQAMTEFAAAFPARRPRPA